MGTPGTQRIKNYGLEFKLKAVQLSNQPGVLVKDVAESLDIHPFMVSKWRKQVRDGELVGKPPPIEPDAVVELRRLREVEKQFKRSQMEHDLQKKLSGPDDVRPLRRDALGLLRVGATPAQ